MKIARGGGPPLSFSASASVTHPWRLRLMTRLQRLSLLGFICAFTLFSSVVSAEGANQGSINGDHALTTRVVAPWRSHECAVVAEAAEHAAASGLFWEYLNRVHELLDTFGSPCGRKRDDAKEFADRAFNDIASGFSSETGDSLRRLALDARAYAPAIEQQSALSDALGVRLEVGADSVAWAAVHKGRHEAAATTAQDLKMLISEAAAMESRSSSWSLSKDSFEVFPSDHVYDAPCEEGATEGLHITVIVHGMAGTNEFREMHAAALDALSNVCGATYAVRFHYRSVMDFPLYGWGATLDIKNMEYVAVDDREQAKKGTDEGSDSRDGDAGADTETATRPPADEVVGGISFHKLMERYPEKTQSLAKLRQEMLAETELSLDNSRIGEVKMWELQSLGMQAAQYISDAEDPLAALEDISQNFPARAKQLIRIKVSSETRRGVQSNHNMHRVGAWYVNGRAVSIRSKETFNLFELIDSMNKDMANQAEVDAIGVPNLFSKFQDASDDNGGSADQSMKSQIFGEEARIDVVSGSKGSVVYLNNIEKDADYARFSTSLQSLLVRSFNLIPVRKNVYTLLIVVIR